MRAMVKYPAGCAVSSPFLLFFFGHSTVAFRLPDALGIRDSLAFRGCFPTAHTLAHLRFAQPVTALSARLATDLPGSALAGRVSHPLDDSSLFPKVIASFLSKRPASLGRTRHRHFRGPKSTALDKNHSQPRPESAP